jgi:hypothetical protein
MLVTLFLLSACDTGPTYKQVQELDTIEAYEGFLANDPDSIYKFAIDKRLEELYYERGYREGTGEAWRAYLERFPEGPHANDAKREVAISAYSDAVKAGTAEAFRKFVADFPKADKWLVARAEGRAAVLEYGKLEVGEPVVTEVNMAEDPKGPMNGWGVSTTVKNTGDQTFSYVSLTLDYLSDEGGVLATKDYPLVAPTWPLPASEEQMRPLAPGDERTWTWTESKDAVHKDWHQKVRVLVTGLKPLEKKK